jgi:hypothetical protein
MARVLRNTEAVYEELGAAEIRRITGASYSCVCNWRTDQAFPTKTYVVIMQALKRRRLTAPLSLWPGMIEPMARAA